MNLAMQCAKPTGYTPPTPLLENLLRSPLPSRIWPRNSAPGRKRMKRKEQARRNFTSAVCSLQLSRLLGKNGKKMETTSTKHSRVVSIQDKSTTIADEYWGGRFALEILAIFRKKTTAALFFLGQDYLPCQDVTGHSNYSMTQHDSAMTATVRWPTLARRLFGSSQMMTSGTEPAAPKGKQKAEEIHPVHPEWLEWFYMILPCI